MAEPKKLRPFAWLVRERELYNAVRDDFFYRPTSAGRQYLHELNQRYKDVPGVIFRRSVKHNIDTIDWTEAARLAKKFDQDQQEPLL